MKNIYNRLRLAVVVMLCGVTASAQQFEVDGIRYSLDYYGNYAIVFSSEAEGGYTGDIVIPSSVVYNGKNYQVKAIHESAFKENRNLTSVVIPEGITEIPYQGFYGCSNLVSVAIPQSVNAIFGSAFYNCRKLVTITIPEGVETIYKKTFQECRNLTSVVIPNSVTKIEDYAFDNCQNLTSVNIPNCVNWLGAGVFRSCHKITSIDIPEGIYIIKSEAFTSCWELVSVTLPSTLTTIESQAFQGCESLASITFPKTLTEIGHSAFASCNSLTSIAIPSGVVGPYAFSTCTNLASVVINEGVTEIGSNAFYWCQGITSIVIPHSVTKIGSGAFSDCHNLKDIAISENISILGDGAFSGCKSITSFSVPQKITEIENNLFRGCDKLESITLPEGITKIGENAFSYCYNLSSINLPDNITKIGQYAFWDCRSLTHITIPKGVEEIKAWTFGKCKSLKTIDIPEGVTEIGREAFELCGITSITLPKSLTEIEYWAFLNCDSLHTIVCKALVPPLCSHDIFKDAFDNAVKSNCTLFVPDDSITAYQAAEEWKDFYNIYPLSLKDKKFALTYLVDGEEYRKDSVKLRDTITLIEEPTKEGHTFSGWGEVPERMPANDLTVEGTFTPNKYLVTFKIDGEVIVSDSLTYGTAIVIPETPEREGHTFSGWGEVLETVPADDITYEANYTINSYTLTYTVDGNTVWTDSVPYGTKIIALEAPTKEGYTFSGWSEAPETMPAEDITISGTFTVNKYLVTFKIGDEVIAADSLEYGTAIVVPEAPEREGYTFSGWGEVAAVVPANDLIYEGSYTVNSYLLSYTVDGETVQSDSIVYGTAITLPEAPYKEGYTFSGWSEAPETMPAEDVTISGTFTISKYLVTFKIGDEMIAADSLEYGATIVAPEAPEKEGHTFNGWGEVSETVPAGDVTYEGSYTVNIYKVYYYVGEEQVHTAEVAYGEAIPEYIYEPTGEGDVFEGWVGETYATMPAHDVTYVANITNGIEKSAISNHKSEMIFDLMGRKVTDTENLKGGIYIVNGKKVICQ